MTNLSRIEVLLARESTMTREEAAAQRLLRVMGQEAVRTEPAATPVAVFLAGGGVVNTYDLGVGLEAMTTLIQSETEQFVNLDYRQPGISWRAVSFPEINGTVIVRLDRERNKAFILPYYEQETEMVGVPEL